MKIVICGNYGATNLGDEAILTSIVASVRKQNSKADITVLSANPGKTALDHGVNSAHFLPVGFKSLLRSPFTIRKTLWKIARSDMFILGGGGLFTDEKPLAIAIWAAHAYAAYAFKKPVYMYAQSVGPLNHRWSQRIVKNVFKKAKTITVRDQESKDLLDLLDIGQVPRVTADPALLLEIPGSNGNIDEKYIILSVRPWPHTPQKTFEILATYTDWLYEKYRIRTYFVPFQEFRDNDYNVLKEIFDRSNGSGKLLKFDEDLNGILRLFNNAVFIVGMRLHSLIFAYLCKRPVIGLIYSSKVASFLRTIGSKGLELTDLDFKKIQELTEEVMSKEIPMTADLLKSAEINENLLFKNK